MQSCGLGLALALRVQALALALKVQALALALKVQALALALKIQAFALALRVQALTLRIPSLANITVNNPNPQAIQTPVFVSFFTVSK